MADYKNSRAYPIPEGIKWSQEDYTLPELSAKFSSKLPNFLKVTESFYLSSERSLELDDVYHLHGRREQLVYNGKPVIANVISMEKAYIPLNYKDKVNLLPLEGFPWMYNGIREVAMDRPKYFKVTHKPGKGSTKMPHNVKIKDNDLLKLINVNYKDVDKMKIKSLVCCTVQTTTSRTGTIERLSKAPIEIPIEVGGTYECIPDPTEYTLMEIEEIQENYPGKKRVKFLDQTSFKPDENFNGEFILEKTECRSEAVCTQVAASSNCLKDDLSSVQLFTIDSEMDAKFAVCKIKEFEMLKIDCRTLKPNINFKPQEISSYKGSDYDYIRMSEVVKKSEVSRDVKDNSDDDYEEMRETDNSLYDDAVSLKKEKKRKIPPALLAKPVVHRGLSLDIPPKSPKPKPRLSKAASADSGEPNFANKGQSTAPLDGAKRTINSFEDVPEDVTPLSIEELCQVFGLYGLEDVSKKCGDLKIDGSTLMALEKADLMVEPFCFKGFSLVRIMMIKNKQKPK